MPPRCQQRPDATGAGGFSLTCSAIVVLPRPAAPVSRTARSPPRAVTSRRRRTYASWSSRPRSAAGTIAPGRDRALRSAPGAAVPTLRRVDQPAPNPRARHRRSSAELARDVRQGRRFAEALRALSDRAENPDRDDLRLAEELARMLVKRCDTRHEGWQTLRDALQEAGVEIPWSRAERQAQGPTVRQILADCATPGRTPLLRVQHAAAEARARALAPHLDLDVARRLGVTDAQVDAETLPDTLAAAVRARSRSGLARGLRAAAART